MSKASPLFVPSAPSPRTCSHHPPSNRGASSPPYLSEVVAVPLDPAAPASATRLSRKEAINASLNCSVGTGAAGEVPELPQELAGESLDESAERESARKERLSGRGGWEEKVKLGKLEGGVW
jgi:hypothetical protein